MYVILLFFSLPHKQKKNVNHNGRFADKVQKYKFEDTIGDKKFVSYFLGKGQEQIITKLALL